MARRTQRNRTALLPTDVQETYSYVDSIGFRVPARLPPALFDELCASLHHAHGWFKKPFLEKVKAPHWDRFHLFFWLHQPTRRSIELLQQYQPAEFYSVHVALDLCVASPRSASKLEEYVLRHIHKEGEGRKGGKHPKQGKSRKLPSWRSGDKTHIGHTYFWEFITPDSGEIHTGPGRRGSQLVVYSDLPSKVTGGSCVHVEYRVGGARALLNDQFPSPDSVQRLDHREFWKKRLHFLEPPSGDRMERVVAEAIGRRIDGGAAQRSWEARISEAQEALASAFEGVRGGYRGAHGVDVAYVLRESGFAGTKTPLRLFEPVSCGWMLPKHSKNEFWIVADRAEREREGTGEW
jgi:hypothetical protein